MKTITKIIYTAFAAVVLAIAAPLANGALGDLVLPTSHGHIVRVPLNPIGTPTFVWDNSNLPPHFWMGISFDPAGNIYVSEDPDGQPGTGNIYKLPPDRSALNLFATGLWGPRGLAVDTAGNLYEADLGSGNIYKFTPDGARSTFFSSCISGSQIVFDSQGNLFVASCAIFPDPPGCNEDCFYLVGIYKIDAEGGVTVPYLIPWPNAATAIAFDNGDNLWVVSHDWLNGRNKIFLNPVNNGEVCYEYFGIPSTGGLTIDSFGNIYIGGPGISIRPPCTLEAYNIDLYSLIGTDGLGQQLVIEPPTCVADTWATKAPSLQAVAEAGGAVVNGQFYVFDGSAGGGVMPPPQVYDPVANHWSYRAPDPIVRANTSVGVINDKIFVAEGWINADSNRPTNRFEVYDPATDSWTSKRSSQVRRGGAAAAVINGKLYLAGGSSHGGSRQFRALEIYDPVTDSWSAGAPMPKATGGSGTALNDKFYMVGGTLRGVNTGMLLIYDPATNTWGRGASMPTPRSGVISAAINGKLCAIGGNINGVNVSVVEIYDPVSNTWTTATSEPTARYGAAAGVIGSKLYITGGYDASNVINGSLDVYTAECP